MKKYIYLSLILGLISQILFAQDEVEMATGLRTSGKIYAVIAVMLVIFIGLGIYLFTIDRRVKKLEDGDKS